VQFESVETKKKALYFLSRPSDCLSLQKIFTCILSTKAMVTTTNNITKKRGRRMIINHKTEEAGTTTTNQGHIMGSFRIRTRYIFFSMVT
jgi:hypothetical protein